MTRSRFSPLGSPFAEVSALAAVMLAGAQTASAGINLNVSASPDPARPGETLDVEFTLANDGASDLHDVLLVFDYPAGLACLSELNFAGNCPGTDCCPGDQVEWEIPLLRAGEGFVVSVPAGVSNAATFGTVIPFNAEVFDDAMLQASASTDLVVGPRELELALVEDRDPTAPGDPMTYTLTFGVIETSPGSPNAVLSMPVPAATTFVSASHGATLSSGVVQWPLGDLGPGEVGERQVTVQIDSGTGLGSIIAAAATYGDDVGNAASYQAAARVQADQPLELAVTAGRDPIRPGELLDIELTVTNIGPFDRTNVFVVMEWPDHLDSLSELHFDGNCPGTSCETHNRAFFTVGTLSPGQGATFSVPARITGGTADGVVTSIESLVVSDQAEHREAGSSIAVDASNDLELAMIENRDPVAPGGTLRYTLTYGVLADSPGSTAAMLSMPVPDGTTFVSASDGGVLNGGVVEWPLGDLNARATGERELTVQVEAGLGAGSIITAECRFTDMNAPMNAAAYQAATRVQAAHPLGLKMMANRDPARPGELMDVELTATNTGQFDLTGVVLVVEFPDGLNDLTEANFGGNCPGPECSSGERAFFNSLALTPGGSTKYLLPVRVGSGVSSGTVIPIEATITDAQGDFRETGSAFAVDGTRELDLALVESDEPIAPGGLLTYTLTFGACNTQGGAPDGTLRLSLPEFTTFVSASDGGAFNGNAVEWEVGNLNPGAGGERMVTVQVDDGVGAGAILEADARFDDASVPVNEIRIRENTRIAVAAPFDVELNVFPEAGAAGRGRTAEFSVTNTSEFTRTDVVLVLEFPDGLDELNEVNFSGNCPGPECTSGERAFFDIPSLGAGETVTFPAPLVIASGTVDGTIINFDGFAVDGTGFVSGDSDAVYVGNEYEPAFNGDLNQDGMVGADDFLALLASWGPCPEPDDCPQDTSGDGVVGVADMLALLGNWG